MGNHVVYLSSGRGVNELRGHAYAVKYHDLLFWAVQGLKPVAVLPSRSHLWATRGRKRLGYLGPSVGQAVLALFCSRERGLANRTPPSFQPF
jgi:hypothetical protein